MSDATVHCRPGEEVDAIALLTWLLERGALEEANNARAEDITCSVRQFPSGFSNLTYLVTITSRDLAFRAVDVIPRMMVLRRPPRGVKPGVAHDMAREHDMLAAVHPLGIPVPRPIALCDEASIIGAPFYLMEYVEGTILRGALPGSVSDEAQRTTMMRELSTTFVATLAQLHRVDVSGGPLASMGKPHGYVQRQVQGWTRRWHASKTDDIPELDAIAAWLMDHQPKAMAAALVHNDFKLDNIVMELSDVPRVKAILDWEMATVGDPLMDLGTSLAYWVEAGDDPIFRSLGLGVTALPGALKRAELVQEYAVASGQDVGNIGFYHAFGLFKLAIIAQQIYARHVQGLTADPRFGSLLPVIRALGLQALRTAKGKT
jgi:aminoglycoside phosphotransferase (APT) family kinase protein